MRPETEQFCVTCGGPDPLYHGECADCVRKGTVPIVGPQAPVFVEACKHCGVVREGEGWTKPSSVRELIEQTALGAVNVLGTLEQPRVGVGVQEHDAKHYTATVDVEGTIKGVDVTGEATVEVRLQAISCDACSRRHGGYYEATLQLRAESGKVPEDILEAVDAIIDETVVAQGGRTGSLAYLLRAKPQHGGYDYQFGTMEVARAIGKKLKMAFGAKLHESSTVAGRRDGRDLHRLTIAVRIPDSVPGAFLALDGEVLQVVSARGNRLITQLVPGGDKRTLDERQVQRARVLEVEELDVVYAQAGEGQVLDPATLRAVEVRLPPETQAGERVRAVLVDDAWFVVGRA